MKNVYKLFGIIAMLAVIGFGFAACGGDDGGGGGNSKSVELTANDSGEISIQYSGDENMTVTVTTNLPSPNNSFTMTTVSETKTITGLTPGQKVNVTVTVSGTVSKFTADNHQAWFQVYKN